jgi:CubicO group peptidase (beta-lactamase class C family)
MTKKYQLPRTTPESMGVPSAALLTFVEAANATIHELHGFMLLRHGSVIAEGWWAPYAPQHRHILFSLTKSFTSTAVGMAVAEGRLSIDDPVLSFFPEDAPKRLSQNLQAMRVRHLLSMTTGHLEDATEKAVMNPEGNWVKGFFSKPVKHVPGAPFVYNSAASHMLSAIVHKLTGQPLSEYLRPRLFEPVGIEDYTWQTDPRGINTGGWGLAVKTEDIARFGQLYLQKGTWNGVRLLPEAWVEMATSKQSDNSMNEAIDWKQGYGFQFWRCQHNAYRGDGAFGQYCVVMPDQDAVLAINAGVQDMQSVLDLVYKHILPNLGDTALPEEPEIQKKLTARLQDLCLDPPQGKPTARLAKVVSGKEYKLDENPLRLSGFRLDFVDHTCQLTFETAAGEQSMRLGAQSWAIGTTALFQDDPRHALIFQPEAVPVAGAYAWKSANTLELKAQFHETPFVYKLKCKFAGEQAQQVSIETAVNVSFGPTEFPVLTGRAG